MQQVNIRLNEDDLLLLKLKGISNFTEFVRDCVEGALAEDDDICPHCGSLVNPRRSDSIKIGREIREKARAQKRLIDDEETLRQEIELHKRKREAAIDKATLKVTSKIRNFGRYLPEADRMGNYTSELEKIAGLIATVAEADVSTDDVVASWRRVQACKV